MEISFKALFLTWRKNYSETITGRYINARDFFQVAGMWNTRYFVNLWIKYHVEHHNMGFSYFSSSTGFETHIFVCFLKVKTT
jgi:hypothetical protein